MPQKKKQCPTCQGLMSPKAQQCRQCKPPYERTAAHRASLSAKLKGRRRNYRSASTRPEVAAKIAAWWTPERREAKRQEEIARYDDLAARAAMAEKLLGEKNPRYQGKGRCSEYAPGFGRGTRRRIKERDGYQCVRCGSTKRIDTHHKDGSKTNHAPENLETLCRKCHANDPVDPRNHSAP